MKAACMSVCSHLAGVQPVLQRVRAAQAGDDQVIEGVFTCQGQQGSAHADAQQHKQAREMLDPHLQSLRRQSNKFDETQMLKLELNTLLFW